MAVGMQLYQMNKQAGFHSEGAYHSLRDRQGIALSAASVSVLGQ